jgi:hypothetical protein
MNAPDSAWSGAREGQGVAVGPHGRGGAGLLFVDVKLRSAVIAEARRRAITGMFGVPRGDQSVLVTTILSGAGAIVVRDAVGGLWRRPSGSDVAIGGLS